jgi:hypothetical protein
VPRWVGDCSAIEVALYREETTQGFLSVEVACAANGWNCAGGYGSV